MDTFSRNLRVAFRMLWKHPGFNWVIVLSLALGIGANSTIFSLVNGILLKPLPRVQEPDRIIGLHVAQEGIQFPMGFSYLDYRDFAESSAAISELAAYNQVYMSLSTGDRSDLVYGYIVTGNYFSLLGVEAARGRVIGPDDDRTPGAHPVAVLSHGLWERRFGGDPGILGDTLELNGHAFTVVGIAPEGFIGTEILFAPEIFVPMMMHEQAVPSVRNPLDRRDARSFRVIGKLEEGKTIEEARAWAELTGEKLASQYPETNEGVSMKVVPQVEARLEAGLGDVVPVASAVLLGLVGLVLLIACVNVANLLLARAVARRKEIGMRIALGADRGQLIRQLLTESLLLAFLGGLVALLLTFWIGRLLSAFESPTSIPFEMSFDLDHRVLFFTFFVSLLAGVVFGLVPALQASKTELVPALKGEESSHPRRRSWLRSALVVGQVAVSLPLLIGAGLFLRSLQNASSLDLGFSPENVLSLSVDLALHNYDEEEGRQFYRSIEDRLAALPGVESAALGAPIPLDFYASAETVAVPGYDPGPEKKTPRVLYSSVRPSYFETLGTRVTEGRTFDDFDNREGRPVVIVNQAMAERFWPDGEALGRQVRLSGEDGELAEVVGIVPTGRYRMLAEPPLPYMYRPFDQDYHSKTTLLVKTTADPEAVIESVRRAVAEIDPDLPVFDVRSLDELISGRALMPFKLVATLAGAFGLLGLVLATLGLYGIQSFNVTQRRREIGLRMALGARWQDVVRLVLRRGLYLALVGMAIGLFLAFGLGKAMARLLLNVSSVDPVAFGGVTCVLVLAVLLASIFPARRAIRTDPVTILKEE